MDPPPGGPFEGTTWFFDFSLSDRVSAPEGGIMQSIREFATNGQISSHRFAPNPGLDAERFWKRQYARSSCMSLRTEPGCPSVR